MNSKNIIFLLLIALLIFSVGVFGFILDSPDKKVTNINVEGENTSWSPKLIYDEYKSSIATIYISNNSTNDISSQGSGFLFNHNKKYVMTNYHVIGNLNNYTDVHLRFINNTWTKAEVIGTSENTDLAILKANKLPRNSKSLELLKDVPKKGSRVVSIGTPNGNKNTLTTGRIINTKQTMRLNNNFVIPDTLSTDTLVKPGSSGSPLINKEGEVVGITRALRRNVGLAISSRLADRVSNDIINKEGYNPPLLGVQTINLIPPSNKKGLTGLQVVGLLNGTDASDKLRGSRDINKADIITGIDGNDISTSEDLSRDLLLNYYPGDEISLEILRNGSSKRINVTLSSRDIVED